VQQTVRVGARQVLLDWADDPHVGQLELRA
jgi:hypothetical protein